MGGKSMVAAPPQYTATVLKQFKAASAMATRPKNPDMVTLRVTAVAVIEDEAAKAVAFKLIEDTARDLQLKLLLLADGLPGVEVAHRVGDGTLNSKSISSETLPLWVEEQSR